MSLNGALNVGRTGLAVSQMGLQVAGNNMANAATPGFHRRSIHLAPLTGEPVGRGHLIGRGVQAVAIRREVDEALQARLRDALSDENAATASHRFLSAIETIQNELTDNDLSSLLSEFFAAFSEVANNPSDHAVRAVVIQQGRSVADRVASLRADYAGALLQLDDQIGVAVNRVNDLLGQLETIHSQIVQAQNGVGEPSSLLDQRDLLVDELATFLDVSVIEHDSGSADILVNSIPIFLEGRSRGVRFSTETVNGQLEARVRVDADGTHLNVASGLIGGLLEQRDPVNMPPVVDTLDTFAQQLIFEVNKLHAQGQGQHGFTSVTGTYAVDDTTVPLNHADADLPFTIENGSFFVNVTHRDTGVRTSHRINVDPAAMSLDDLVDEINTVVAVPNTTAAISSSNTLVLTADAGYELSFSDDTSGTLAALGINTFFTGESAVSIGVNDRLVADPALLAVGSGHVPGSNGTALAIAALEDTAVDDLGGISLRTYWQDAVSTLAVRTSAAAQDVESSALVRESLAAQHQAVSGVSIDEESINLLQYQRQFQAAARYITVIDEALQVLLSIA